MGSARRHTARTQRQTRTRAGRQPPQGQSAAHHVLTLCPSCLPVLLLPPNQPQAPEPEASKLESLFGCSNCNYNEVRQTGHQPHCEQLVLDCLLLGAECSSHPRSSSSRNASMNELRPTSLCSALCRRHLPHPHCYCITQAGCKHCYDTPFASRPAARARPKEGRYHDSLPPAPTFHPTAEQWQDPFAYLSSIAPEATKAGIALIVPPKGWEPPIQMLDQQTGQLRTDLKVCWRVCWCTSVCGVGG